MAKRKIYTGFDLIKLFAAICIIAIHTNAPLLNIIGRLGVPFFAIVSSVLFFNHYQHLSSYQSRRAYLRKFCKRIFLLYATWQILYIPIAMRQFRVIMSSLGGISCKNLFIYIIDFIFPAVYNAQGVDLTQDANGWGPSWYLLASIVAMPIFLYLLKAFRYHIFPLFLLCLLIEGYIILADEFNRWTQWSPIMNHTFFRLIIYFCLGYLIVSYQDRLNLRSMNQIIILFVFFFCLFFVENVIIHYYSGNYNTEEVITTVPTGFLLTIIAMKIHPILFHSTEVRNLSTFLYCFQIWPIVIMRKLFNFVGWGKYHFILFITVLLIALIVAYVYERSRRNRNWRFLKYMV